MPRRYSTFWARKYASSLRNTRSACERPETTYGNTVGEYGSVASRVTIVTALSVSCIRSVCSAESAAWLEPMIR